MTFIPVGRVVSTHGIRGEVKFRYYNESGSASLQYPAFFADHKGTKRELVPTRIRPQGRLFLMTFEGLDRVEEARLLVGAELFVRGGGPCPFREDEYYDYQLIGLGVVTVKGQRIGTVKDVMHTGANDILVVQGEREVLVPMTEECIFAVNTDEGIVRVREEGLVE
jgi:16S rRNA processing protein RimM